MERFGSLKVLDIFFYEEGMYMKIKECTYRVYRLRSVYDWSCANAINLRTGKYEWFNNSNKCTLEAR